MVIAFQPSAVDWQEHEFAFLLRVEVEHTEAQKYAGDYRLLRVGVETLLELFDDLETHHSFAIVGTTAELYPDLVDAIAQRHALVGHSLTHAVPYQGMPFERQRRDLRHMRRVIHEASGINVRGVACPFKGLADEHTIRAALEEGLAYVASRLTVANSKVPKMVGIEGSDLPIVVPGAAVIESSDWSDRRSAYPYFEESFSAQAAERRWMACLEQARRESKLFILVIHAWMTQLNGGEMRALGKVVREARDMGAWMTTDDLLLEMVQGTRR